MDVRHPPGRHTETNGLPDTPVIRATFAIPESLSRETLEKPMGIGIYSAMTLRRPDTDYDRQLLKVPLRMVKTCSHVSHVCADPRCLLSWAIDHEIHLGRTAPGRALRARLDADTVRRVSVASPPPMALVGEGKNAHQDGTHHEWIHLVWTEVVTYAQDIQIDVPDAFEGDRSDLIDVDDDPLDGSDALGVPSGYRSRWLERADLNVVHDVSERQAPDRGPAYPAAAQERALSARQRPSRSGRYAVRGRCALRPPGAPGRRS